MSAPDCEATAVASITWRVMAYLTVVALTVPLLQGSDRLSHGTLLAAVAAAVLRAMEVPATRALDVVTGSGFAMHVAPVCDGADLVVILGMAILLSPAPWRLRAWGIAAALLLTQLLNLGRLVFMFVIGVYAPEHFDLFHHVLWQVIAIVFCVGLYAMWLSLTPVGRREH